MCGRGVVWENSGSRRQKGSPSPRRSHTRAARHTGARQQFTSSAQEGLSTTGCAGLEKAEAGSRSSLIFIYRPLPFSPSTSPWPSYSEWARCHHSSLAHSLTTARTIDSICSPARFLQLEDAAERSPHTCHVASRSVPVDGHNNARCIATGR